MCVRVCASLCQKGPYSQSYDFSSSHVHMWDLNHKESWAPKNCCFWTVVLEKTLECPLDCKEVNLVNPKSVLNIHWKDWCWSWSSSTLATWCKNWLMQKPWCWEKLKAGGEGDTEDEMVAWYHQLDGHEFEQALGVGDGWGSLAWCSPWDHKELDITEWLNWTEEALQ